MNTDEHRIHGVEPVWIRTAYRCSEKYGVEEASGMEFFDFVDEEVATYECSCGAVIEGYDEMVDHLVRMNIDEESRTTN